MNIRSKISEISPRSNIPILYEDDWILAVDKPAGLLTIPTPRNEKRTLTSILNDDLISSGLSYRLHPCHRLDRETSGAILYAKGKSIQNKIMQLFRAGGIKKTYVAFVEGNVSGSDGCIDCPIEGRRALTKYKVSERKKGFTILQVMPFTGRTNQIRIHLAKIGHPILGEAKYAFRRDFKIKAKRVCLHAKLLEFVHPLAQKAIIIESVLAPDLKEFLKNH